LRFHRRFFAIMGHGVALQAGFGRVAATGPERISGATPRYVSEEHVGRDLREKGRAAVLRADHVRFGRAHEPVRDARSEGARAPPPRPAMDRRLLELRRGAAIAKWGEW